MQGTQHGLGSSKSTNEIKPAVAVRTHCLMGGVQTGVPLKKYVCMNKHESKISLPMQAKESEC